VIVDDVNSDPRYLSCSIKTKSEIVVPIYAHRKVIGEIDIDSHNPAAFTGGRQGLP
jgi:L-methionine (R)-S-oxide reductase